MSKSFEFNRVFMIKIKIYNQKAEAVGEMQLSSKVFGVPVNEALVHQAVVTQMANERQVIAHTKDRSEVRGGGRKPWKQKGTGRARHGSSRSPIWIGGGVTFGPRNERNFKMRLNKKMKQNALLMALSDKAATGNLLALDKLEMAEFKTKIFNQIMNAFENLVSRRQTRQPQACPPCLPARQADRQGSGGQAADGGESAEKTGNKKSKRSYLIIIDKTDDKIKYSANNLPGVEVLNLDNINLVDLLKYKNLVMTKAAVEKLEERYKSRI